MPERFRPRLSDAGVAILLASDPMFALGLDARELQLLTEDLGEFLEAHLDLEDMVTFLLASRALLAPLSDRVTRLAVTAPNARIVVITIAKVGQINPAMASLATIAVDVAKGISQVSVALLGMLGLGAAIGGIVFFFKQMAEAAERAEAAVKRAMDAQREQRDEGLTLQASVRDQMEAAGIYHAWATRRKARTVAYEMRGGKAQDLATATAVASQIVMDLVGEKARQFEAGLVVSGERPQWVKDERANRGFIERMLKAGRMPGAEHARREYNLARTEETLRAAATKAAGDEAAQRRDTGFEQEKKSGTLTEREREVGRRLLQGEDPAKFRRTWDWWTDELHSDREKRRQVLMGDVPSGDATHTMWEILEILNRIERSLGLARGQLGGTGGVTVNFQQTKNETYVDTMYAEPPETRELNRGVAAAELTEGGNIAN